MKTNKVIRMKSKLFYIVIFIIGIGLNVRAITPINVIESSYNINDGFKKVDSSELTPPVVEEILKQYPTSKLGGVYKNAEGKFKLIMVLQSGTRRTVYIDKYGNWLKKP